MAQERTELSTHPTKQNVRSPSGSAARVYNGAVSVCMCVRLGSHTRLPAPRVAARAAAAPCGNEPTRATGGGKPPTGTEPSPRPDADEGGLATAAGPAAAAGAGTGAGAAALPDTVVYGGGGGGLGAAAAAATVAPAGEDGAVAATWDTSQHRHPQPIAHINHESSTPHTRICILPFPNTLHDSVHTLHGGPELFKGDFAVAILVALDHDFLDVGF